MFCLSGKARQTVTTPQRKVPQPKTRPAFGQGVTSAGLLACGSSQYRAFPSPMASVACPVLLSAYSCGGSRGFGYRRTAFPFHRTNVRTEVIVPYQFDAELKSPPNVPRQTVPSFQFGASLNLRRSQVPDWFDVCRQNCCPGFSQPYAVRKDVIADIAAPISSGSAYSSGQWLIPSRQRRNNIVTGQRSAMAEASWVAPEGRRRPLPPVVCIAVLRRVERWASQGTAACW